MTSREANPAKTAMSATQTQLVAERTFDAPPEKVWAAWSDPRIITRWWRPYGFSTTTHEPRDGGTHLTMRMTFPTPQDFQRVVRAYGADEGLRQTVTRLAEFLAGAWPAEAATPGA